MKGRIEVLYANGEFRAYPNVNWESIIIEDEDIHFEFGEHGHVAYIIKSNVNFIEFMPNNITE